MNEQEQQRLDLMFQVAADIFEPNNVKINQDPNRRPIEFTITVLGVPKKHLENGEKLTAWKHELDRGMAALNVEIADVAIGYERKMLRYTLKDTTRPE